MSEPVVNGASYRRIDDAGWHCSVDGVVPGGGADHPANAVPVTTYPLAAAWQPARDASLIHEASGAVTFRAGANEVILLRYPLLPTVVGELESGQCLRSALAVSGVPASSWNRYARAVMRLAEIGFLVPAVGE